MFVPTSLIREQIFRKMPFMMLLTKTADRKERMLFVIRKSLGAVRSKRKWENVLDPYDMFIFCNSLYTVCPIILSLLHDHIPPSKVSPDVWIFWINGHLNRYLLNSTRLYSVKCSKWAAFGLASHLHCFGLESWSCSPRLALSEIAYTLVIPFGSYTTLFVYISAQACTP